MSFSLSISVFIASVLLVAQPVVTRRSWTQQWSAKRSLAIVGLICLANVANHSSIIFVQSTLPLACLILASILFIGHLKALGSIWVGPRTRVMTNFGLLISSSVLTRFAAPETHILDAITVICAAWHAHRFRVEWRELIHSQSQLQQRIITLESIVKAQSLFNPASPTEVRDNELKAS